LGLIAWRCSDDESSPGFSLLPHLTHAATAVRCARVSDAHLWFTTDACLWAVPLDDVEHAEPVLYRCGSPALTALCFDGGTVYAADVSGRVLAFDAGDPASQRIIRNPTGQPIESLQVVDTSGVPQLVIADRSSGLTTMVLGDQCTRRYEAPAIVRRAVAAGDLFVAMNDGRDRLLAWDPRRPEAPVASVVIPYLTGTTAQDIALIPAASSET
jgi:hypothetical protein